MVRSSIQLMSAALVAIALGDNEAAFAQGTMQQQDACRADVFRLCSSSIPDVSEIVACLRGNEPRLSDSCRQIMFSDQAGHEDQYQRPAELHRGATPRGSFHTQEITRRV